MELASGVLSSSHCLSEGLSCVRLSETGTSHGVRSQYGPFFPTENFSPGSACTFRRVAGGHETLLLVKSSWSRSSNYERKPRHPIAKPRRTDRSGHECEKERWAQVGQLARSIRLESGNDLERGLPSKMASSRGRLWLQGSVCKHGTERLRRRNGFFSGSLRRATFSRNTRAEEFFGRSSKYPEAAAARSEPLLSPSYRTLSRPWRGVGLSTRKRWMWIGKSSLDKEAMRNCRVSAMQSDSAVSNTSPSSDSTSTFYLVKEGDTLTSIAKISNTSVKVLADANKIEDVDFLLSGQLLVIPKGLEAYEEPPSHPLDEFPISRVYNLGAPLRRSVSQQVELPSASSIVRGVSQQLESHHLAASVRPAPALYLPKLAVAVLLIAPLLGYCIRCIVDALYIHMDREEVKHQAEREAWETLHQPKAKRWQKILEEDRDGMEFSSSTDGSTTRSSWAGGDAWTQDANLREKTRENNKSETDEEIRLRHKQDYEDIRKSYAELESTYVKFLADSGMSKSGYWRGSGVPTTARLDDGEPR